MEARGGMPRRVRDRALFPNKAPDHVIPLADGGGHEPSNLQTLCRPCHARKSAREAAERAERRRTTAEQRIVEDAATALTRSEQILARLGRRSDLA